MVSIKMMLKRLQDCDTNIVQIKTYKKLFYSCVYSWWLRMFRVGVGRRRWLLRPCWVLECANTSPGLGGLQVRYCVSCHKPLLTYSHAHSQYRKNRICPKYKANCKHKSLQLRIRFFKIIVMINCGLHHRYTQFSDKSLPEEGVGKVDVATQLLITLCRGRTFLVVVSSCSVNSVNSSQMRTSTSCNF